LIIILKKILANKQKHKQTRAVKLKKKKKQHPPTCSEKQRGGVYTITNDDGKKDKYACCHYGRKRHGKFRPTFEKVTEVLEGENAVKEVLSRDPEVRRKFCIDVVRSLGRRSEERKSESLSDLSDWSEFSDAGDEQAIEAPMASLKFRA
jgi:hypothetical protein